jgi:hypothetical protein
MWLTVCHAITLYCMFLRFVAKHLPRGTCLCGGDVIHCGAAYSEFNARVFACLESASLPVELRCKANKDGHTPPVCWTSSMSRTGGRAKTTGEAQGE